MKPISLEFSGLNSYREPQRVDFAALAERGLFGIFGETGAGKSTILDAVTLALYGEVERAANKTQGIINVREKTCFVRFRFTLSGHCYTAERVYERKKDDPYASRGKSCRLVQDDGQVLADKNEEMTKAVEELLGMNQSRFCQTVILPQGKFDKLLTMAPAERSALVEELFHFSAYGEALVKKLRQKLRSGEEALSGLKEQRLLLGDCSEQQIRDLEHRARQLEEELRQAAEAAAAARELLSQSELADHQARELAEHEAAFAKLLAEQPLVDASRRILEQGREAEKLRPQLQTATELHQQVQGAEQELREAYLEAAGRALVRRQRMEAAEREARLDRQGQVARQLLAQAERTAARVQEAEAFALAQQEEEQRLYRRWQQAEERAETARRESAAAYLATELRPGEPCPVCGSLEHRPPAHPLGRQAATQALNEAKQAQDAWRQQNRLCDTNRHTLAEQRSEAERLRREAELAAATAERQARELDAFCRQIQSELAELEALTAPLQTDIRFQAWLQEGGTVAPREGELSQAKLRLALAVSGRDQAERQLEQIKARLLSLSLAAGFATVNEAKKALLDPEELRELERQTREHGEQLRLHAAAAERLRQQLTDYDGSRREQAEEQFRRAAAEQNRLFAEQGHNQARLARLQEAWAADQSLEQRQRRLSQELEVLKRLANLLKGNAFVRHLARGSLLSLAHEASHILFSLTNSRYQLELVDEGRGGDFIMVDNHNGGLRRQAGGLSGGETFLVSLALALALSRKIEMRAAPLGFFFLDEGFGSLDENALEAALTVLERLPSDQRSVGVITHVKGVKERMPRYLLVSSDPLRGSQAELKRN